MLGKRLIGAARLMTGVLFGLVGTSMTPAMAQNLYQVSLNVPSGEKSGENSSEENGEEETVLVNAFERMLLKVTGSHQRVDRVMQLPTLPPMDELVYQQQNNDSTLQVSFNQYKVNQLLRSANIDVWPEPRPRVLVWIAQQTSQAKVLIAEHQPSDLVNGLHEGAQQRALPVTLPLLDFDDLNAITFTDVWGRFLQPVAQASQRYQAEYIALVKVQVNDDNPAESQMIWQLIDKSGHPHSQGEELGLLEDSGVALANQLADYFADNLAAPPQAESDTTLLVDIDNIKGMTDVVMVKRYFEQLTEVHQVKLASIKPNGMQLSLKLLSSQAKLIEKLNQQGQVTWQEQGITPDALALEWVGNSQSNLTP